MLKFLNVLALTKAEKKILLAVFSILTAMCTIAYFAHRKSQQLITSAEAIEQSEEIKFHIYEILSIAVDMESGVYEYVLTGDETSMAPANEAIANIFIHMHELGDLPGVSETQMQQIVELRKLVDEKTTVTSLTAELRRQKGMDEAMTLINEGKGRRAMNAIRSLTKEMLAEEDKQLALLKIKNHEAISHFAITFYLLVLKISITVIAVIVLFVLYFRQRNKAEKVLKESQELFQNVLDHTRSMISIKDLSGRYLLINKAYEKLVNMPRELVKGNTAFDLFDHDVATTIRNTDLEVIREQQQLKVEEVVEIDGETRHFVSLKFPLFDSYRIPYAICSISTDETEKAKSDAHHKEEMHRILDLFNNAPCGYLSSDPNGIIIEINETLLKWLGYTRAEVVGKMPSKNLVSPESMHQFTYYFPRIKTGEIKSVFDVEVNYVRKDGARFAIVANSVGMYDEEGNFQYTRTSVFDISYRRRLEEVAVSN